MGIDTRFDIINGRFYLFVPSTQLSKLEDEQKGNGTRPKQFTTSIIHLLLFYYFMPNSFKIKGTVYVFHANARG